MIDTKEEKYLCTYIIALYPFDSGMAVYVVNRLNQCPLAHTLLTDVSV